MASFHIIFAILLQVLLACADDEKETITPQNETIALKPPSDIKDFHLAAKDWIDLFRASNKTFFPSPSAALMAHVTNSNKTAEEQLEDIKIIATKIGDAIKNEMASLLTYAMGPKDPSEDNNLRKRRSISDPMDSTKLVTRLLNHMKSNNDYQNLAIEKMMTAQEIADKYGIEFTPDTGVLSDLAVAANNHASELTSLLKDACKTKKDEIDCVQDQPIKNNNLNDSFYIFIPDETFCTIPKRPDIVNVPHHYHRSHHEQPRTTMQFTPATPRPTYYDTLSYNMPNQQSLCSVESKPTILPEAEDSEVEPRLVGEELEETITSKVYVDHENEEEPTVNHVMTYTVAEKSHFKKPEIEKLPQHLQYCFYLI